MNKWFRAFAKDLDLIKHLLIVGSGSVGRRHALNFKDLGARVSCVDPRRDRLLEIAEKTPIEAQYLDIESALTNPEHYDGVVICSPPSAHVSQGILALRAGIPVLLEKPVSNNLNSARALSTLASELDVPILLGYTWRWWPPLQRVKSLLAENVIGRLLHVQFHMSAHLADWHPWERYQDFFMAKRELGGGALLDESHWVDLALWFFGSPVSVQAQIDRLSDLDIDTDDNVDMLLTYPNGMRVSIHLDIFSRPHEKFIRFVGDQGTVLWTAEPNRILKGSGMIEWDNEETFACERNDMFLGVAEEFLGLLNNQLKTQTCDLNDGLRVLEVLSVAKKSSIEGRRILMEHEI